MNPDEHADVMSETVPDDPEFEAFLHRESKPLIRFLIDKQASGADAHDIAQESQIRLMRYRGQPHGALKVLLYQIAMNILRDSWRKQATRPEQIGIDVYGFDPPTEDPGPDQRAIHQQDLARVREAIFQLPVHCRRIFLLNRIEGMSYSQIARASGVSVKAIEKQMSKALSLLRKTLTANQTA